LTLTSNTDGMKRTIPPAVLWILGMMSALSAWACVIWVSLEVSSIVLDTLHQIVELAGMTP